MVVLYNGEPITIPDSEYLVHHGVIGQKWGVRRYQNPDGTLTEKGQKRYNRLVNDRYKGYNNDLVKGATVVGAAAGAAVGAYVGSKKGIKTANLPHNRGGVTVYENVTSKYYPGKYPKADGTWTVKEGTRLMAVRHQVGQPGKAAKIIATAAGTDAGKGAAIGGAVAGGATKGVQYLRRNAKESKTSTGEKVSKEDKKAFGQIREQARSAMMSSRNEFSNLVSNTLKKTEGQKLTREQKNTINTEFKKAYADVVNKKMGEIKLPSGATAKMVNDLAKNDVFRMRIQVD